MTEGEVYRNIRMTPELMAAIATRDDHGHRLVVDWGAPDADGFYEPTVTVDLTDSLVADERARIRAIVEGLPERHAWGECVDRAAVLALVEGER